MNHQKYSPLDADTSVITCLFWCELWNTSARRTVNHQKYSVFLLMQTPQLSHAGFGVNCGTSVLYRPWITRNTAFSSGPRAVTQTPQLQHARFDVNYGTPALSRLWITRNTAFSSWPRAVMLFLCLISMDWDHEVTTGTRFDVNYGTPVLGRPWITRNTSFSSWPRAVIQTLPSSCASLNVNYGTSVIYRLSVGWRVFMSNKQ